MTDWELLGDLIHPSDRASDARDAADFRAVMESGKYRAYYEVAREHGGWDDILQNTHRPRVGEVGCRYGYSLFALAKGYHEGCGLWPELLYSIDNGERADDWALWVLAKLQPLMPTARIHLHATDSQQLNALLETDLDICHIDGNHAPSCMVHDAKLGWAALRDGGLLLIDDVRGGLAETVLDFSWRLGREARILPTINGLAVIQK